MRQFGLMVALLIASAIAGSAAVAAELDIPPRPAPANVSMQQGPPNCSRWTDDCVNCARSSEGEAPLCSNIGVACQPKAIRCLSPEAPVK
jgi:hypothetical protein